MIDFNGFGPQGSGVGAIPPDSCVVVNLHIVMPPQGKTGSAAELTRTNNRTTEYLNTELVVVEGKYKGAKIRHRFLVGGAVEDGQKKSVNIAMKQLCAILEVSRRIAPDDASPQATEARRVNGWSDFEGMSFPIKVGCEASNSVKKNDPTHYFVNNTLVKVVTMADGEFASLSQPPYELISALPVPEYPVEDGSSAPAQQAWGAPQAQAAPVQQTQTQGWGAPAPQAQTPPPAATPTAAPMPASNAAPAWAAPTPAQSAQPNMDQVPF